MMKTPVCIIRFSSYPKESHVRRDARSLLAAGYEVDIIASRDEGQLAQEDVEGVRVYRLPVSHRRGSTVGYLLRYVAFAFLCFFAAAYLQIKRRYKIVEVDTMPDFLVFSTFVPKLLGAKIILYLFEAMPELFMAKQGTGDDSFVVKVLTVIERWAVRYADHVITVNEVHRSLVAGRCPVDGKISVVLNVPDEELLPASVHKLFGVGDPSGANDSVCSGGFVLVHHGTIEERYGVQTAVRALAAIRLSGLDDVRLLIIGAGDYLAKVRGLIGELNLQDQVEFVGWVDYARLIELLAGGDIGLVPFIRDGYTDLMLPNKLFEYVALGIPVVAARTRAVHEYYNEDCAAYFEPGNEADCAKAIVELYNDAGKRKMLTENARSVYQTSHRWNVIKEKYTGIYRRLLGTDL
jgi:glycosyltransferase involved in cell wall biosynthesis